LGLEGTCLRREVDVDRDYVLFDQPVKCVLDDDSLTYTRNAGEETGLLDGEE